jgi:hypothetical protein
MLPVAYGELRRLRAGYLSREGVGHTLQPTALVHEAYLRLVDQRRADWRNRAQFLGLAAGMTRRILVNHARDRGAAKRGATRTRRGRGGCRGRFPYGPAAPPRPRSSSAARASSTGSCATNADRARTLLAPAARPARMAGSFVCPA